jgi:hypothetical protein
VYTARVSVTEIQQHRASFPRSCRSAPRLAGRCLTAWWLGLLVAGCGRADSGDRAVRTGDEPFVEVEPTRVADAPAATDAGAVSPPDGGAPECPAPQGLALQGVTEAWARNPSTGSCCHYDNINTSPRTWTLFSTGDACQNDCRCAVEDGQVQHRPSIECICSVESCPSSIEEAALRLCDEGRFPLEVAVQRLVGCGMVMVIDRNGFSGDGWVFEQPLESTDAAVAAPRLVGATRFSDATSEICDTSTWLAGRDFLECDLAEVVACQLCGDSPGPDVPPCE